MDCKVGKKVAGWSHPEGDGQWFRVPTGISGKRCPSEVQLRPMLFRIFIDDVDEAMESIFSKLAGNRKMSDEGVTLGGLEDIQGNLDELKKRPTGTS